MKKLLFFVATAAVMVACNNKPGYTVTGTVEGAADGDTVFMGKREGRQMVNRDTAVIAGGVFTFEGVQEIPVQYYVYTPGERGMGLGTQIILENGTINVSLANENSTVGGTANNDAYQAAQAKPMEINKKLMEVYTALRSDSTLTEEQRAAKEEEFGKLREEMLEAQKEGVRANITNAAGGMLLKNTSYYFETEELDSLLKQLPAMFDTDERITSIRKQVEALKATAVGQKFTDFAMKTPEGKDVKLSDFAGKGKVVLVDFWASWCGPCRAAMPQLVELYKQYKNKGFEIVGVSLDREGEAGLNAWKKAIKDLGITWPQMSDLKFWQCEGAKLYGVNAIPALVLIDGEGTIIARDLHGKELADKLAEVIK